MSMNKRNDILYSQDPNTRLIGYSNGNFFFFCQLVQFWTTVHIKPIWYQTIKSSFQIPVHRDQLKVRPQKPWSVFRYFWYLSFQYSDRHCDSPWPSLTFHLNSHFIGDALIPVNPDSRHLFQDLLTSKVFQTIDFEIRVPGGIFKFVCYSIVRLSFPLW